MWSQCFWQRFLSVATCFEAEIKEPATFLWFWHTFYDGILFLMSTLKNFSGQQVNWWKVSQSLGLVTQISTGLQRIPRAGVSVFGVGVERLRAFLYRITDAAGLHHRITLPFVQVSEAYPCYFPGPVYKLHTYDLLYLINKYYEFRLSARFK